MTEQSEKMTHFALRRYLSWQKGRVQDVFGSVANCHDIMNDVVRRHPPAMERRMMDWLAPVAGQRLLDVAGGTGDIAFRFLKRAGQGQATVLT